MKARKDKYLVDKFSQYQDGTLNNAEKEIIDEWFDTKLDHTTAADPKDRFKTERLKHELFNNIRQVIQKNDQRRYWLTGSWLKAAALVFIISAAALFTFRKNKTQQIVYQSFSTVNGKTKKIILPDGTEIWMNASTTIRIANNFNSSKFRKVYLDHGQAFFHVKRDTLRPFSIKTEKFITTVLGTSFDIKSYPELHSYQVAVTSGKVKVDYFNHGKSSSLNKGLIKDQVLTYNLKTEKAMVSNQNVNLISHWKTDRALYLNNLNLVQIGAELARQFNLSVEVTHAEKAKNTYTLYIGHQPIQHVLQNIALETGMNYQLTTHHLILNPM